MAHRRRAVRAEVEGRRPGQLAGAGVDLVVGDAVLGVAVAEILLEAVDVEPEVRAVAQQVLAPERVGVAKKVSWTSQNRPCFGRRLGDLGGVAGLGVESSSGMCRNT